MDGIEADVIESAPQHVDEHGGLDVVINNAGSQIARANSMEEVYPDQLDRVMKTNLHSLFWLTPAAVPLLESGASITNTTSIQMYEPSTSLLDYAATKVAVNNFTVNLAGERGPRGSRTNMVAPRPIWTPLRPATQDGDHLDEFGSDTSLGRAGRPGEVAPAFVFVASPADAGYGSGTVVGVTGGTPVF